MRWYLKTYHPEEYERLETHHEWRGSAISSFRSKTSKWTKNFRQYGTVYQGSLTKRTRLLLQMEQDDAISEIAAEEQMVVIKEEPASEYATTIVACNTHPTSILPRTDDTNIDQFMQKPSQLAKSSLLYKCDYCVKQFDKAYHKNEHVNSVHKKIRYQCPECQQLFTATRFVVHHMRTYHNIKSVPKAAIQKIQRVVGEAMATAYDHSIASKDTADPGECAKSSHLFECDYCDKKFIHKCNKDNHIDAVHRNIRHECPKCQKLFTQRKSVVNHVRRVHNIKAVPTTIRKLTIVVEMVPDEAPKEPLALSNTELDGEFIQKAKQPKIEFIDLEGNQDNVYEGSTVKL